MFGDFLNSSGLTVQGGTANQFGGEFFIYPTYKINDSACIANPICRQQAFYIYLTYIPQEACIDLITQDWSNAGVSMIQVSNDANPTTSLRSASIIPPASIDHAVKICEMPANATYGARVLFYFDIDVTQGGRKTKIDSTMTALNGS